MFLPENTVICADCREVMADFPDNSVDLIITSPPYARQREKCYGGTDADQYSRWFLSIAKEIRRILKPAGSFFLNIKAHSNKSGRSLYIMDLVAGMVRKVGFYLVDEFAWVKQAFPGHIPGRFKNAWEPVYHFTKSKPGQITFNATACGTPIKDSTRRRAQRKQVGDPGNGSGMGQPELTRISRLDTARPSNVLQIQNTSNQHGKKRLHPATFPVELADFFIKSFSNPGDLVLDPFAGSGTVGVSAVNNGRRFLLIEKQENYCEICLQRLEEENCEENHEQKTAEEGGGEAAKTKGTQYSGCIYSEARKPKMERNNGGKN